MRWQKLGKIFDPTEHKLPLGCNEFAQSPQALVFDDKVRIYFSTRERDEIGKYISHVAYVDFDKELNLIKKVSSQQVIEMGALGTFDEHGIFPLSPFRDGSRILGFTTGWNRKVSVSADASIGMVESFDDGETYVRASAGPILSATLTEPFLVGDAFVKKIGSTYFMWYIFGMKWKKFEAGKEADRVYKIAQATSQDGKSWLRSGLPIIRDTLNEDECQALPTVIEIGGVYHMYFCYREAYGFRTDPSRGYRLGYAYSNDLINWVRDDAAVGIEFPLNQWDSDMQCYPNIFECDGTIYLLYNGNKFGRFGFGAARLMQ